jgi:hypothetical protein
VKKSYFLQLVLPAYRNMVLLARETAFRCVTMPGEFSSSLYDKPTNLKSCDRPMVDNVACCGRQMIT